MNRAAKGNKAELASQDAFQRGGAVVGSRRHIPGPGDLLVWKAGQATLLVEVKASGRPFANFRREDRAAMKGYAEAHKLVPVLAWWAPGAKEHQLIHVEDWPKGP